MTSRRGQTPDDRPRLLLAGAWLALVAALTPGLACAYVGPGLGLGAIATLFALIGAVLIGIVGFIWYPVKRLIRAARRRKEEDS